MSIVLLNQDPEEIYTVCKVMTKESYSHLIQHYVKRIMQASFQHSMKETNFLLYVTWDNEKSYVRWRCTQKGIFLQNIHYVCSILTKSEMA